MKKRGFTLIEVLAVIVVLGIIALIVTPIVTGFISSSEEEAYNKQVDNIVKAAKLWNLQQNEATYLCTAKSTVTNGNLATGEYNYGDEYSCNLGDGDEKTFYVLEDGDTSTLGENGIAGKGQVSLIMNMNIGSDGKGTTSGNTVAWCKSGNNNSCAANGAIEYLNTSTSSWTKLNSSQISLPTGHQIATAGGDAAWTDSNFTGTVLLPWLYGNLNSGSVPYAYWTSTPAASYSKYVWSVSAGGVLYNGFYIHDDDPGIRPVITIPKSEISSYKYYISLDALIDDGILENNEIINPKTNEKMEGCISVTYVEEYKQYEYRYIENGSLCK